MVQEVNLSKHYAKKLTKQFYRDFKRAIKREYDCIHIINPTIEQEKYLRGIGKTTTIIKLAIKYNIPICYKNYSKLLTIKDICNRLSPLSLPSLCYIDSRFIYRELKGRKIVLVDEDISIEDIRQIKEANPMITIIGFSRIIEKN